MSLLELKKVSFKNESHEIIKNVSFQVEKGDYLFITGPSGSGKSTLLKLMATILTPSSGEIYFAGKNQQEYAKTDYRRKVSYCFQQAQLFGKTVKDNLSFPFEIRQEAFSKEKVLTLLDKVALSPDFLEKPITELSGGEKQRVALIRNLVFLPEVLLLDEVTTGLDEVSKNIVQELIFQTQQQGVTLIQVSHDDEDVAKGKSQIKIVGGEISHE